MTLKNPIKPLLVLLAFATLVSCQGNAEFEQELTEESSNIATTPEDAEYHEHGDHTDSFIEELGCLKPTAQQISPVNLGNEKKDDFLAMCLEQTQNSSWCHQLVRPNPSSKNTFRCTYGSNQPHQLIHPSTSTWKYPIRGVQLIQTLAAKGIRTCEIYNWWRPEPYNKNVGGAAGRHPYGTSIDVRFCSNQEAIKAFNELCKQRKAGKIRAIGYYGGASLHLGVGDATGNTWGKSCPN